MEIKGPNLNSYPSNQPNIRLDANNLHNGQIIKAIVANISSNKVLFDIIEPNLSIKLEAPGISSFKPGQIVTLQVANLGPPISLTILDKTNKGFNPENIINAALRQVIPRQSSMNQLVANLQYLSNQNPKLNEIYPQEVLDLSRVVFQRFSSMSDVSSASGIKNALNSTGIFLEHQLQTTALANSKLISNDTRTSLLRLAESIRSNITESPDKLIKQENNILIKTNNIISKSQYPNITNSHYNAKHHNIITTELNRIPANLATIQNTNSALSELLRNIEGSLSKIQYNQLQHFIPDDQSKTNWFFDLPIRREECTDIFQFMFTKDGESTQGTKTDEWSVTLTFNLEKLGDVSIQIYLRNNKIGATVWAKKSETYQLFNQYLSSLQDQMERSGIEVSNIRCNKGELNNTSSNLKQNILDEEV